MYRPTSLAGADSGGLGTQRARLLRIYLGATTFLYLYGVVFTLFPVRTDLTYANPVGGIIAIALGVAALLWLWIRPDRVAPAIVCAIGATPIVMAFHVSITAEYVCLIAPMFLAMYLRAFHPPRQAWSMIAALTAGCLLAVGIAPAPHVGVITFLIFAVAIVGAAESFGVLIRAMFAAACTDPLTGLLNRAGWEVGTTALLKRSQSSAVPVTVVALDIDGLKALNDTYGHQAGDRRITDYAEHWKSALPRDAVLARLGGDEFAACIAGDSVQAFLDAIARHTPEVSVGAATRSSIDADVADLYAEADAALYLSRGRPLRDEYS